MGTPITVQNKIQLLVKVAEKRLTNKLTEMGKELNNDHTLVLDILLLSPEICRMLALACELTKEEQLQAELEELKKREQLLNALEATGVDNWAGYDEAMIILEEQALKENNGKEKQP